MITQQLERYTRIGGRFVLDQRIDEGGFAIHHTHAIEPVGLVLLKFPVHERAGDEFRRVGAKPVGDRWRQSLA